MICTTQYHTAAIMQEQYSGTVPEAAGNFGRPMLPWALEDPETSKQDRELPRLNNSLNSNPIKSPPVFHPPEENPHCKNRKGGRAAPNP